MALDKVKQGVIADDAVGSSQIAPDTVVAADIGANAVGTSELADNAVTGAKVENNPSFGGTSHIGIPAGTTAQRPGSASAGNTRFNSTTGSLEFYDGNNWVSTNLIPNINSVTGTIYGGASSTLTLSLTNASDTIDVRYYEGGTLLATDTNRTVTNGSATSTVPSAVYGQTAGDTISIQVVNSDGTPSSNNVNKTVSAVPSGGTKSTSGNYHIHTFTTSDATGFTNTIANLSVEYLVIGGGAAGGGGQYNGGGGGAGGYRTNVSGQSSGGGGNAEPAMTLSVTNYPVVIGAGQAGKTENDQPSQAPTPFTSFNGIIAQGGGGGGKHNTNQPGAAGGSGGGASQASSSKGDDSGAGTANQGYPGGAGWYAAGAGGGGAGQRGALGTNYTSPYLGGTNGVKGGDGVSSNITGSAVVRAGGGGGGGRAPYNVPAGVGGSGGGGNGGSASGGNGNNGSINTGSGGGGGGGDSSSNRTSGAGGSGVVIVRYQLP